MRAKTYSLANNETITIDRDIVVSNVAMASSAGMTVEINGNVMLQQESGGVAVVGGSWYLEEGVELQSVGGTTVLTGVEAQAQKCFSYLYHVPFEAIDYGMLFGNGKPVRITKIILFGDANGGALTYTIQKPTELVGDVAYKTVTLASCTANETKEINVDWLINQQHCGEQWHSYQRIEASLNPSCPCLFMGYYL